MGVLFEDRIIPIRGEIFKKIFWFSCMQSTSILQALGPVVRPFIFAICIFSDNVVQFCLCILSMQQPQKAQCMQSRNLAITVLHALAQCMASEGKC